MKRKVCKIDKIFVDGEECPICKGTAFSTTWQGRFFIHHLERSEIGKKIGVKHDGEYAIKVR